MRTPSSTNVSVAWAARPGYAACKATALARSSSDHVYSIATYGVQTWREFTLRHMFSLASNKPRKRQAETHAPNFFDYSRTKHKEA